MPETRKLFRSSPQQRVHIEKITVDGIEAPQGGIHYFPTATGKVEIMCNAPAFKTHGKIRYKFRLQKSGYDILGNLWPSEEEVAVGVENPAVYASLTAGRYVFTVSAGTGRGPWPGESSASMTFFIKLSFFESIWFYLLLLVVGLGIAALVIVFFKRRESLLVPVWSQDNKYKTLRLARRESAKQLKKILEVMENEKPYTDPTLTMQSLAEKIGISKESLSQVINKELRLNFNAFVNRYRVEAAKKKLRDPAENQFILLKIAFDVGFNSKTSFNTVFKKVTGMSPSEYKKKYQKG
ncbi:MAG: helix-turn-helix transcriptional regulator [bacterium]|nr:helix-turn-helix transcriptional regulator [bacterium]